MDLLNRGMIYIESTLLIGIYNGLDGSFRCVNLQKLKLVPLSSTPSLCPQELKPRTAMVQRAVVARPAQRGALQVRAARIGGVDIPNNKRIEFSLQYIFGIGSTTAKVRASTDHCIVEGYNVDHIS